MEVQMLSSIAFMCSCMLAMVNAVPIPTCQIGHLNETSFAECGNKGYAMRCNSTELKQIPRAYPRSTDTIHYPPPLCLLDLSHNNFYRVKNGSFVNVRNLNATDVLWLYLDFSNVSYIESNAFVNLTNLIYLNLSGNHLNLPDSLGFGVFSPLLSLKNINLKEIRFSTFDMIGKELKCLKNLTGLFIDLCNNCTFGADFESLPKLEVLSLSGRSKGACSVPTVLNETFRYVTGVRYLYMASCAIDVIEADTFKYLTNISLLDISYNSGLNFSGMNIALYGLRNSSTLKVLNVNRINPMYETGIKFDVSYTDNLQTLQALETLHMDLNKIEVFDEDIFKPFRFPLSLRVFTLSGNRLTFGSYIKCLQRIKGVTRLDISRQHLNFDPFFFEHYEASSKTEFHVYRNFTIPQLNRDDCPANCSVCVPTSLHEVIWRQSFVYFKIESPLTICGAGGLKHLDMSFNLLLKWNDFVSGLDNLTYLDLSENYCDEVKNDFFAKFTSLEHLNISGNMLGTAFDPAVNKNASQMFQFQKNLKKLDMSDDKITRLPVDIFKNLKNLTYLSLSGNFIDDWNSSLEYVRCLRELDLSKNKLYMLPEALTNYLDSVVGEDCDDENNVTLRLIANPLECSCKSLPFLKWMRYSKVMVLFRAEDSCRLNGENFQFSSNEHLEELIRILEFDKCLDKTWVIWTVSAACSVLTFVCSIVVCSLVYRNRWKLRYIYYSRNRRYMHEGFERLFDNDAFVSYAKNSARFIKNQMVPVLEEQHGVKLWVADRNSLPGTSVAENICHGIYNSRKSVLLINKEYLNDSWCDYEMNMANMESIKAKRKLIIIVLLEQIPMNKLPVCIMRFLQSERSLEYPQDKQNHSTFWMNLADEINS